jgi:hypothetical protein
MTRVKLSPAQRAALALLAERQCYTARSTYGDMNVAGLAAKSLVRMGLARYVRGWPVTGSRGPGMTVVEITAAGVAALES